MHFHLTNLNDLPGDRRGNPFWHGQWHLDFGRLLTITFCWNLKSTFCHARFSVGGTSDDSDFGLSWAFPPVAFWLHFSGRLTHGLSKKMMGGGYDGREVEVAIHHAAFWGKIWAKQHSWSCDDPWWMHWHLDFVDLLLGRRVHSAEVIEARAVRIPMPEGAYEATAELRLETWKRSRWPWPLALTRAHIDIPDGVPVPGKGENSWDCGPDATFGTSMPAGSIEEGIGNLVGSTLALRRRRGGGDDYSQRPRKASGDRKRS